MAKQTAMQALVELLKVNDIYKECMPYVLDIIDEVYLPMEKEQIQKAFSDGQEIPINHPTLPHYSREEYYNEMYCEYSGLPSVKSYENK